MLDAMNAEFAGLTDTGLVRTVNQDAYYIDPEGRFFIVADGMGGHAAGQEASRIAKDAIQKYLSEKWDSAEPSPILLENAFLLANQAILDDQQVHPDNADMGTTAVAVIFRSQEDEVTGSMSEASWYGNLGDSRIYRLRQDKLEQMSEDDTWVAQAVKAGALSEEDARMHPWRHVLSQCLGRADLGAIEVEAVDVQPGDRLLLCSDGLTEELTDEVISDYLQSVSSSQEVVSTLVEAAKEKGGRDNITVVTIAIEDTSDTASEVD